MQKFLCAKGVQEFTNFINNFRTSEVHVNIFYYGAFGQLG